MAGNTFRSYVPSLLLIMALFLSAGTGMFFLSMTTVQANFSGRDSDASPFSLLITEACGTGLQVNGLCYANDELFVSYRESDRIDVYDPRGKLLRILALRNHEPASITGLAVQADLLCATDFLSNEILFADPGSGKQKRAYGFVPDGVTRVNPYAVTMHGGMLYVSDVALHAILVISSTDVESLREQGEVVLRIPKQRDDSVLRFPTFTHVTQDGRLLISDLAAGNIVVFSCSGRYGGTFSVPGGDMAPMGICQDDVPSTHLQARKDSLFDPSGIFDQGRIHVADARQGCVRVFDAAGAFLGSYGDTLISPVALAIDKHRGRIYVADPGLGGIAIFNYRTTPMRME